MAKPKRALGQGVNVYFPTAPVAAVAPAPAERSLFTCPIDQIDAQPGQPRRYLDEARLQELAESIKDKGLIEPIVVRRSPTDPERYEIIAGERRWRASQLAGLTEIQVVVKELSSAEAFELALVENILREDLNPIELAEAYHRLMQEHQYTHDQIGQLVRKDRSTITNTLRLRELPVVVREHLATGKLFEGHGRVLLGLTPLGDPFLIEKVAERVVREDLSVRKTEAIVTALKDARKAKEPEKEPEPARSVNIADLERNLQTRFGAKVLVKDREGKGKIVIPYGSLDELDRVLSLIR